MTSQNRRARAAGSSASSAWRSVVPERGSPVANIGRTTLSSAIGWRFRSSKNARRVVSSQWIVAAAAASPAASSRLSWTASTTIATRAARESSP